MQVAKTSCLLIQIYTVKALIKSTSFAGEGQVTLSQTYQSSPST